jgi:hypothetical protein
MLGRFQGIDGGAEGGLERLSEVVRISFSDRGGVVPAGSYRRLTRRKRLDDLRAAEEC